MQHCSNVVLYWATKVQELDPSSLTVLFLWVMSSVTTALEYITFLSEMLILRLVLSPGLQTLSPSAPAFTLQLSDRHLKLGFPGSPRVSRQNSLPFSGIFVLSHC